MDGQREPIFNVPGPVVALVGAFAAVHMLRWLLVWYAGDAADDALVDLTAFNPLRYGGTGRELPGGAWTGPTTFLTHAFLHGDVPHLVINSAWLLAVGSVIARRMPLLPFLGFFALCAAGGALAFLVLHPGLDAAVVGASGAISGLMAAALRLMFAAVDTDGRYLLREHPAEAPRLSVRSMLTRSTPRNTIIAWVIINFVGAVAMSATGETAGAIAWEAHLGGFFTGLMTFDLFDRGRAEEAPAVG